MEKSSDKEKIVGVRVLYKLASSLAVHNMAFLKGKAILCVNTRSDQEIFPFR